MVVACKCIYGSSLLTVHCCSIWMPVWFLRVDRTCYSMWMCVVPQCCVYIVVVYGYMGDTSQLIIHVIACGCVYGTSQPFPHITPSMNGLVYALGYKEETAEDVNDNQT